MQQQREVCRAGFEVLVRRLSKISSISQVIELLECTQNLVGVDCHSMLQTVSGAPPTAFWASAYLWDLCNYAISAAGVLCTLPSSSNL